MERNLSVRYSYKKRKKTQIDVFSSAVIMPLAAWRCLCFYRFADGSDHIEAAEGEDRVICVGLLHGKAHPLRHIITAGNRLSETGEHFRKGGGLQRTGIVGRDRHKTGDIRGDARKHFPKILIRHHTGEGGDFFAQQIGSDIFRQGGDTLRIVTAVNNEQRLFGKQLKASGPRNGFQSGANRVLRNFPALLRQNIDCRQRDGGVFQLVSAQKRKLQIFSASAVKHLTVETVGVQAEALKIRTVEHGTHGGAFSSKTRSTQSSPR